MVAFVGKQVDADSVLFPNHEVQRMYAHIEKQDVRIAALEDALRRVVRDVNDYEQTNKLHPNPGRTECWDSVAHAKTVLANR